MTPLSCSSALRRTAPVAGLVLLATAAISLWGPAHASTQSAQGPESAQPAQATTVWVLDPVLMDAGFDPARAHTFARALQAALNKIDGTTAARGVAFLLDALAASSSPQDHATVARAREVFDNAQDLYLRGECAPSAAGFAEAATMLRLSLLKVGQSDAELLEQALMLQGVAWLDAGSTDAAVRAFVELLAMYPNAKADPVLMPPMALALFEEARGTVRARGVGTVEVRSDPAGADVALDGVKKGATPLSLSGVTAGRHVLSVATAGYLPQFESVNVVSDAMTSRHVKLVPHPANVSMRRVRAAAVGGESASSVRADLEQLHTATSAETIVLSGAALRAGEPLVLLRAFSRGRAGEVIVVHLKPRKPAADEATGAKRDDLSDAALATAAAQALLSAASGPDNAVPRQVPLTAGPVALDTKRAVLGLGPDWGGEPLQLDADGDGRGWPWWVWAATGTAVAVAGAAGAYYLTQGQDEASPSVTGVEFVLGMKQ